MLAMMSILVVVQHLETLLHTVPYPIQRLNSNALAEKQQSLRISRISINDSERMLFSERM